MTNVNIYTLAASAVSSSLFASKPIRWYSSISSHDKRVEQIINDDIESIREPVSPDTIIIGSNLTKPEKKNTRMKSDGTIVTDADGAAQRIIVDALRRVSSEIRIVGEESQEDERRLSDGDNEWPWESDDDASFDEVSEMMNEEIKNRTRNKGIDPLFEVDPARISVFIDPLDGTKSYARGAYDSVTMMIAILIDNIPCFGVLCKPFGRTGETSVFDSECFVVYGGTLLNGAYIAGGGECPRGTRCNAAATEQCAAVRLESKSSRRPRAVISKSRSGGVVKKCIDALSERGLLDSEPLHITGAGEKTLWLIMGFENATLWFFPKPGTSLWDIAVADAILMAIGGKVTDKDGNNIDYSRSRNNASNDNGIVISSDTDLHSECLRMYLEAGWESDEKT